MTSRKSFTIALVVVLAAPPKILWGADAGRIQFENRQKNSGVNFVLDNGTLPDKPMIDGIPGGVALLDYCLLYTSPSPRDLSTSRMPSSA